MDQVAEFARIHLGSHRNKPPKEMPKPENLEDKHTGFYCFKCKKTVFPAAYKVATIKARIGNVESNKRRAFGVCKDCGKPISRMIKLSKEDNNNKPK